MSDPAPASAADFTCARCGQRHRPVRLRTGQHARCTGCGTTLRRRSRLGPHALPALAVTALVLAVPAGVLPLVSLSKFRYDHASLLSSSMEGLNHGGLPFLALLVGGCVLAAPVALAALLAAWCWATTRGGGGGATAAPRLRRVLDVLATWSMPEVYVLGVLIAFVKLGELADAVVRPGLWCYAAMAVALLSAWRTFVLEQQAEADVEARPKSHE